MAAAAQTARLAASSSSETSRRAGARYVDGDDITVAHEGYGPAVRCFRNHMAHAGARVTR